MSNNPMYLDDRRGLLFTINGETNPVYQVESKSWVHAANRWNRDDIPREIRDKIAYLRETGKPGAFVRLNQEGEGAYLICEENIKNLPEAADDALVELSLPAGSASGLAPYDIILCTKAGTIQGANGETFTTPTGDYYIIKCQAWGRFALPTSKQPDFIKTTRDFLLLIEGLHKKNYFSMSPDPESEGLPVDFPVPLPALEALNCYVLNLSRFTR